MHYLVQHFSSKTMGKETLFVVFLILLLLHKTAPVAHDDGWSMNMPTEMRAIEGYPVVLPCSFTHPHHTHHSSIQVVWRLGHGQAATLLLQCTVANDQRPNDANLCQDDPKQDQRYRLEGNPREHDLSLRVNSAALQDSGRYYCRVEIPGHPQSSFENKMGTRLRVEAPPRILGVSVVPSENAGYKALCRVQGSPLPDIQWIGKEDILEGAPAYPLHHEGPAEHHTSSQLQDVQPGGQYTCAATNPLGKDQATLFIAQSDLERPAKDNSLEEFPLMLLLSFSLGTKVILFLGMAVWMAQEKLPSWVICITH
ncbi:sialic acid-binding Ig-like lectin 15 [Denticeps clupeoides]|uniref:Ig-like domain-containing protein n=1 Tax=Denticeps clupeoides TaxID=299321 RepID=A0AAY4A5L4_9TELE|nr:sialic acid-binding Ig-like lectin 15 [Denticeps clupeoides]